MLAGRLDEARQAIEKAISIYQLKGDVVSATRSLTWAEQLA